VDPFKLIYGSGSSPFSIYGSGYGSSSGSGYRLFYDTKIILSKFFKEKNPVFVRFLLIMKEFLKKRWRNWKKNCYKFEKRS